MRHIQFFYLSVFSILFAATSANAADLTIDVQGIANETGDIRLALYDSASGWMKKPLTGTKTAAKKDSVSITIKDIPQGEYAISMYHDENGNGKMDSNAIGIPIEPYAFSNDAAGSFGPPNFDQAKFKLDADKKTIVINFK